MLSLLVFVSGFFTGYVAPMQPVYVGTAVFTLLEMAADRWLLFKSSRGIEAAVFLCMMKIYIFCIISGVSYSLDMPAISFYSFMIVMSILFIASPWKLDLFNFLAGIIFCICSFKAKPVLLALADIYNCWVLYGVASAVSFCIVPTRRCIVPNSMAEIRLPVTGE